MNPIPVKDRIRCGTCRPFLGRFSSLDVGAYRIRHPDAYACRRMIGKPDTCWGVCHTPLPIRDKSLINTCLLNPILDKDLISYSNSLHITTHFWCTSVGAYRIRPTNTYVNRQMIQSPGTCWGVYNTPLPIRGKYLINEKLLILFLSRFSSLGVGAYGIRPTNAYVNRQMIQPPGTCRGVCFCALPIPIKNLIPIYWINLKPGGFWGVCLCDQHRPGEKLLKFVWMHAKPGEDWMKMAISIENPPRIGRKWPYSPKTRRGLDENGHIRRKPGEDRTKMAIFTENPARIG